MRSIDEMITEVKTYCPIVYSNKWAFKDVLTCMTEEHVRQFTALPQRVQAKLIREFGPKIGKGFGSGLTESWSGVMRSSIWESGLLKGIEKGFVQNGGVNNGKGNNSFLERRFPYEGWR